MNSQPSRAAIWITTYHVEAGQSAISFRRNNPGVRTYLFTPDFPPSQVWFDRYAREFNEVIHLADRQHPDNWFLDSVNYFRYIFNLINEDQFLYLDADTYVTDDIMDLFELLDAGFHFVGAHAPGRVTVPRAKQTVPPCFPEINIGVNAFRRCNEIYDLFDLWYEHFYRHADEFGRNDQPALRHALYHSPDVRLGVIPPEYNCRFGFGGFARYKVKVLHGRPQDGDYERVARVVNKSIVMRSWKRGELG